MISSKNHHAAPTVRRALLIAIILFRPQGLLGRSEERTV